MNRLTDDDLNFGVDDPGFVALGAPYIQQINDATGVSDPVLDDFATAVANEPDDGSDMDSYLATMGFTPGDFQSQNYDPINAEISAFYPGFESTLSANESDLKDDPTPGSGGDPNQPPSPPSTGGGGSGGGSQGACPGDTFDGRTCDQGATLGTAVAGAGPQTVVGTLASGFESATLVWSSAPVWSVALVPDPNNPGSGLKQLAITIDPPTQGHYTAVIQYTPGGGSSAQATPALSLNKGVATAIRTPVPIGGQGSSGINLCVCADAGPPTSGGGGPIKINPAPS